MKRGLLFFAVAIVWVGVPCARSQQASLAAHWTYEGDEGPSHWGDLDSTYVKCKVGQQQSPIDIRHAEKASLPPIEFAYHSAPLKIVDNGHTVMVNYASGSAITVG